MNSYEKSYSYRNFLEQLIISTPKFQGFKHFNMKNSINIENNNSYEDNNSIVEKRNFLSEKRRENKSYININKTSKSNDKKKYFNSIFSRYFKLIINKKNNNFAQEISFDGKSYNYFSSNKNICIVNNKSDIKNNKNINNIEEENISIMIYH